MVTSPVSSGRRRRSVEFFWPCAYNEVNDPWWLSIRRAARRLAIGRTDAETVTERRVPVTFRTIVSGSGGGLSKVTHG
jgi:hypothetical protein